MNHSKADGPKQNDESGFDAEQQEFGGSGLSDMPAAQPDCEGKDYCGDVQSSMSIVSSGEGP
jgi:hypothetical protein